MKNLTILLALFFLAGCEPQNKKTLAQEAQEGAAFCESIGQTANIGSVGGQPWFAGCVQKIPENTIITKELQ